VTYPSKPHARVRAFVKTRTPSRRGERVQPPVRRRLRLLGGACVVGALVAFGVGAAVSDADNVVVTSTTATLVNADTTTALPGVSVSGFSDPTQQLLVSLSTNIGSLSLSETSGLTLSYGYSSFSGAQISFTGDQADVESALSTASLTDSGTTGTAAIQLDVTADQAGIEYLGPTGHYYEYVPDTDVTWTAAAAAAQTYTFDGQTGYLASIPDAAVNTFVTDHLNGAENVWAGGMSVDYPSGYDGNTGIQRVWSWQYGPLAGTIFTECSNITLTCDHVNDTGDYTDWNPGEPNNDGYTGPGTGEHYLEINYLGEGAWNDIPNSTTIAGYVVEFGNDVTGGTFTGSYSASSDVTVAGAPAAPSAVQGTRANGQVTVSWTAPSDNNEPITGYTVTAEPGGETCTTTGADSCVVPGLNNGTSYAFTVTATNTIGTGSASGAVDVTPATVPTAPVINTAVAGDGQTTVSWSAPANGGNAITGYTVTAQPGGETCTTTGADSCVVPGLNNGTSYAFTVTATNGIGNSSPSGSASATPATVPGAPTAVTGSGGDGQATVSWTDPVSTGGSAIVGYTVTAQPGGASCTATGASATSCVVDGLTNGTSYTFTVTAANGAGSGPASQPSEAVVPVSVPAVPTDVSVSAGNNEVTVSWTPPASNGGETAQPTYTVTTEPGGQTCTTTATSCLITGLANGTAYTFVVTAANTIGTGETSTPSSSVMPMSPAGAPTDVTASGGNGMTTISWTPPSDDGGTTITHYTVTAEPGGQTCTTTTNSCIIKGLANGTGYTFIVTATNAAGTGPAAHTASVMHGNFSVVWHRQRLVGMIYIELQLPSVGTVSLLGTHSNPKTTASAAHAQLEPGYDRFAYARRNNITITKAGAVHLTLRPTPAGQRLLRRHATYGMPLHIRVWISYTPTGGQTRTISRTVRVLAAHQ
jgi:hypothetical protein